MAEKINLKTKEGLQFVFSIIVLLAGITMVFLSLYIQPIGIIHYTVITVLGMLLSFVGAVWNIDLKYNFKTKELESRINDMTKKEGD